jgi:hypothetical protein
MRTISGGAALRSVDFRFTTPLVTAVSPARVLLTGVTVTVTGLYMGISFSDVTNITLGSWPVNLNTMSWSQDPLTTAISLVFRSPSVRELGSVPVTVTTASGGQSTSSSIPAVMVTFYREKYTVLPPLTTAVVPEVGLFGGYLRPGPRRLFRFGMQGGVRTGISGLVPVFRNCCLSFSLKSKKKRWRSCASKT